MGFYGIHAANAYCRLRPLNVNAAWSGWSVASWRMLMTIPSPSAPPDLPSLTQPAPRFSFQSRAIDPHFPDRAIKSIQRNLLSSRRSRSTSALRRWMLPTVERGPPIGSAF
jgi:hypothetical protein